MGIFNSELTFAERKKIASYAESAPIVHVKISEFRDIILKNKPEIVFFSEKKGFWGNFQYISYISKMSGMYFSTAEAVKNLPLFLENNLDRCELIDIEWDDLWRVNFDI